MTGEIVAALIYLVGAGVMLGVLMAECDEATWRHYPEGVVVILALAMLLWPVALPSWLAFQVVRWWRRK